MGYTRQQIMGAAAMSGCDVKTIDRFIRGEPVAYSVASDHRIRSDSTARSRGSDRSIGAKRRVGGQVVVSG